MADNAIEVDSLSKQYHLGHRREQYDTLRDQMRTWTRTSIRRLLSRAKRQADRPSFWALKDVSFEVQAGDVVGIIGRNGAGKSTLLKILSRITEPTQGEVRIRGRVGSLLEVGTGFHPELTGRENIFLNGAILGMRRTEIRGKFDEIVGFAEIDKFLDTPVKHYSSGMYARLAFAVAAHLEPEILIVDEVLAVGDAEFQKKCFGKMGDVAKTGRTVLFVSHNITAVGTLCNKGVLLEKGTITSIGDIGTVTSRYLGSCNNSSEHSWDGEAGDDFLRLRATKVESLDTEGIFHTAVDIRITAEIEVRRPVTGLVFGIRLFSSSGSELLYSLVDDKQSTSPQQVTTGRYRASWVIPANTLAEGRYSIGFGLGVHNQRTSVLNTEGVLTFHLENTVGLGRRFSVKGTGFESLFRPNWVEGFDRC